MDHDPAWFATAIQSGSTESVVRALSAVRRTWPSDRAELIADNVPWCPNAYADGDAYTRRAVVAFLEELARSTTGLDRPDRPRPRDRTDTWWTVEATLLAAIRDEDATVRADAVDALTELASAYRSARDEESIHRLVGRLRTLSAAASRDGVAADCSRAAAGAADAGDVESTTVDPRCPRCGGSVTRYELDGVTTHACDRCGYAGVPIANAAAEDHDESWARARQRFRRRFAEG